MVFCPKCCSALARQNGTSGHGQEADSMAGRERCPLSGGSPTYESASCFQRVKLQTETRPGPGTNSTGARSVLGCALAHHHPRGHHGADHPRAVRTMPSSALYLAVCFAIHIGCHQDTRRDQQLDLVPLDKFENFFRDNIVPQRIWMTVSIGKIWLAL